MKYLITLFFSLSTLLCFANGNACDTLFPQKGQPGYYGGVSNYTDQQLYALMTNAGAFSTRSTVDIKSAQPPYTYATYVARFQYLYNTLGMRQNVFFLQANPYNGLYTGQSTFVTAGHNRSWLPAGLHNTVFMPDSSINPANTWAYYCYQSWLNYGAYIFWWQIWNEPDLTNTNKGGDGTWITTEPVPDDNPNLNDSLENYVLMCKIANQVIKHFQPSAKIIAGGFGYANWYRWFIRKGGQQWLDDLDIHSYPFYYWTTCIWTGSACQINPSNAGAYRNSDIAAHFVDSAFNAFRTVETQESATHLPMSTTEIAIPRWEFNPSNTPFPNNKYFGSSLVQENFIIKAFNILMRDTASFVTMYQTGETADSGQVTGNNAAGQAITPFSAMGLYQNLTKAGVVGHEVITPMGISYRTSAKLLANYTVNHTKPTLAAGTDGTEWDSSGNKMFVVWGVVTHDTVETASGTFVLPAGQTYTGFDKHGTNLGTFSGTVTLNGAPTYFRQATGVVNNPPTVSAGANQNISTTSTSVTGTATANTGSITSTLWSQVSGPNTATIGSAGSLTTTLSGLVTGTYVFQFKGTNSVPLSSTANVTITVAITPLPPTAVAVATPSTIVIPTTDSLLLNGTGSFDNNSGGFIAQYAWILISGKPKQTIRNPSAGSTYVIFDSVGTYTFQLKVFNNGGQFATTTVTVIVNQTLVNPVAVINANNIITLPLNVITLNGTASKDANQNAVITNYQWNLVTSPQGSGATLNLQTNPIVKLAPVIPGVYTISLTVTDSLGQIGTVTVQITVNSNMIITNKIVVSVH
jgi:hypothetical protein